VSVELRGRECVWNCGVNEWKDGKGSVWKKKGRVLKGRESVKRKGSVLKGRGVD